MQGKHSNCFRSELCLYCSLYYFISFILGTQSLWKFTYERNFNWQCATYIWVSQHTS